MQIDAFGQLLDINVPETTQCAVCRGTAERLSSAWQGEGTAYHHYQCRAEECPAAGTLVEHEDENSENHYVGPVFGDRDLAVRLATRDHPDAPAETREVRA